MEALPAWLSPLPDAETMRAIDRWAIEERGVPGLDLMERAGAGVARSVERLAPDGPVTVLCGKGNNGGDGLVVARLLREAGREVRVVCSVPTDELSGDARVNLERLPGEAPAPLEDATAAFESCAALVDALLGTGFEGTPRGGAAEAIEKIAACPAPVVSVDVPSGVSASTGVAWGTAVRAAVTVTFHAAKPGLWIRPGKDHAGAVEVIDIGIPAGSPAQAAIGLIQPSVLDELPRRAPTWTKFDSGHVLVAGGSRGLMGAPRMTAWASIRAGAGYVTACLPASQQGIFAGAAPPEVMTRGLPEQDGGLTSSAVPEVLAAAERGGALALGPGLGRGEGAVSFARMLSREVELPLVLDADGLNAHAGRMRELAATRKDTTVLTPHAGELARLLQMESAEIERQRLHHARAAAEQARAVVLLKGDDSLIAAADGRVAVSPGGSPALATAGTGDVLAGVIAALLAQGVDPFTAAAAGAWLHAEAGREAARRQGTPDGVIASDVITALPAARAGAERASRGDQRRPLAPARRRRGAKR